MMSVRPAPLLGSLLAIGALTAALAIIQTWTHFFPADIFVKLVITLGMLGTALAFIVAVEYDLPSARSRWLLGAATFLAVAIVILIVAQMWWAFASSALFAKIAMSLLILLGLIGFALAAFEDFSSEKNLRDDKFIN